MAEKEKSEENDIVPPEMKPRTLQRTGNFRKNIRRKFNAQQSDPGYTHGQLSSSADAPRPMTKSSTMPNMPTYRLQSSINSESSADGSYTSMNNSRVSSDTKDKNSQVSSDVSSEENCDVIGAFATCSQNATSDHSNRRTP